MGEDHQTVVPISAAQYHEAAGVLGRAFHNDPAVVSILRETAAPERVNILTHWFNALLQACGQHNAWLLAVHTQHRLGGVAIIYPPGVYPLPESAQTAVFQEGQKHMSAEAVNRSLTLHGVFGDHHPKDTPHYYLAFLGVDTSLQGQGLGSTLLAALTRKARHEGVGVHLETTNPRNVPLYERFQFGVIATQEVIDVTAWFMWRAV